MVKVYADDRLVYAPIVEGYELLDLVVTAGVNKAGTAEITMPPGHPSYNAFVSYSTIVTIYRNDVLLFRGRALYAEDDLYGKRKITCEGERNFLHDVSTFGGYIWQDSPDSILADVLKNYNFCQTDPARRFVPGDVTVTDPNNYILLEGEEAATSAEIVDKLVERCGGYIIFTTNSNGDRVLNWYADPDKHSNQAIEFGENLLDYSSSGANTELATVITPYGAKDEDTGERVTLLGLLPNNAWSIQDDDAVARYGYIEKAVYWDDVTLQTNLLKKAQAYLATSKLPVTTLELTAVDLSVLDRSIDTFEVGDWVRVYSLPHGLDAEFMLRERTYNLLTPEKDTVVLGADVATLTRQDVAGDRIGSAQMQRTAQSIKSDYTRAIASAGSGGSAVNVRAGHIDAVGNTASGNYVDVPVTFSTAFSAGITPTVVVGFSTTSTAGTFGRCSCAVVTGAVTNSGFTLRFFNGDSSNRNPAFDYIAIG